MVRRQKCIRLLTREEETALGRLKPLVVRHLDLLLETMILFIGSDPKGVRLLQDAGGVDRWKKWQREYLLDLFDGNRHQGTAKNAVDPLGLGRRWHLRLLAHVVSALLPLIQEAFESRPRLCRSIVNAMMSVVFHDIERLMEASPVEPRDERLEEANDEEPEVRKTLDFLLTAQKADEQRRLSKHAEMIEELITGHSNICGITRSMSVPLNRILDSAEDILKRSQDSHVQQAVMNIVSQVEAMIHLREPLRALSQGLLGKLNALDDLAGATGALPDELRHYERVQMRGRTDA